MSEKKRRDITLGEMQDECKRVDRKCEKCDRRISVVCGSMVNSNGYFETPKDWDLRDPPRFTEAQMAFWKGWYKFGAREIDVATNVCFRDEEGNYMGNYAFPDHFPIDEGRYDLAELLGKDAT